MARSVLLTVVVLELVWLAPGGFSAVLPLQQFATQPSHQTAVLGSTAVLPCRVVNRRGLVQWTRDGFGLGTIRLLEGFDRYSMIGSDEEGDFSLRISPVKLEDDATYQCQVSHPSEPPIRSRVAKMTVFVPPQPPVVNPGPEVRATAGVPITLHCTSKEGRPRPEIQWLDDKGSVIHEGVVHNHEFMEDGLRSHAHAALTLTPTRHHHQQTVTCLTHNPALNTPLATKVLLNVDYPPEVDLTFEPGDLSEGLEGEAHCIVEANPAAVKYRWMRKGVKIADADGPRLPLGLLSRQDHGSPLACEVTNAVGTTRKTAPINVKYAPLFVTEPSSESAEPGEVVKLKCRVDSNPKPRITWTHVDTDKFVGSGEELTVTASMSSSGTYSCLVQTEGFAPLQGQLHIRLRGPPAIRAQQVVAAREGRTAVLHCRARAVPHPLAVTWTRDGTPLNTDPGSHYHVTEEQQADGVLSILTINKTIDGDFAKYNCSVVNEYGIDVKQIILQKQASVPLMMIVGGGTGVVLVVLVVALFIICGRRSPRRDSKAAEAQAEMKLSHHGGVTNGVTSSMAPGITVLPSNGMTVAPAHDTRSTGQDSDTKDMEVRTSSSLSATEKDSETGWDRDSNSTSVRDDIKPHHQPRYSQASNVFTPPDQGYMSYVDYTREYSPLHLNEGSGESYAQFTMGGPFARSTPATTSDPSSSLPSSTAPPPYTPSPLPVQANGDSNGRVSSNGRINHSLSKTSLKHDLLKDLRHGLDNDVEDLDTAALHSKYIIPPQAKYKPGTLV